MESIIQIPEMIPSNLLLCLRPDADLKLLSLFNEETWSTVLQQARLHDIVPLLYQRLIREKPGLVLPPNIYDGIRTAYYCTLAENSLRYATLAQALAALQGAGIPVLLLKGAHLAELVYHDIGLRPMADFDLLVPRPGLMKALDILRLAGFESEREYFEEVDGNLSHHAPAIIKNGTMLELHWDLVNPGSLLQPDLPGLWRRAILVQLQDGRAQALAPLDLLLYLCVHTAYSHAFHNQFYALCDIREVMAVQGSQIDWQAFPAAVDSWNARKGVYLALRLASELLGANVPPEIVATLEPPDFYPRALEWAQVELFRQTRTLSTNFSRLMRKGTPVERLRALWTALFPSPAVMSMVYGVSPRSWRLVGLYPYNAITRLTSYWRHALDLLKHDPQRIQEADSSLNLLDWLGIKD